jgi:hypothetical protein
MIMGGKRYPESLKERAFRIYSDTGSLSEVVQVLKSEFRGISKSTVSGWSKEKDAAGNDWDARRKKIQMAVHEQNDNNIANSRTKVLGYVNDYIDQLAEDVKGAKVKSQEGGGFALISASKFILEQTGADRSSMQNARIGVRALIDALHAFPTVSAEINKFWDEIEDLWKENYVRYEKEELEK